MFECTSHTYPLTFYFPTMRGTGETPACWLLHCWVMWVAAEEPSGKCKCSPHQRLRDRSMIPMIGRLMPLPWRKVTWFWLKLMPTGGRRKWRTRWQEEPYEVEHQVAGGIPLYLVKNQQTGHSWVLHQNVLYLIAPAEGTPLCMVVQAKRAWCTPNTLDEQTPERSETKQKHHKV